MASSKRNQHQAKASARRRQKAKVRSQRRQESANAANQARKDRMAHRSFLLKVVVVGVAIAMVVAISAFFLSYGGTTTSSSTTSTTSSSTTSSSTTSSTTTSTTTTTTPAQKSAQAHATAVAVHAGCPTSPYTRVNTLSWKKAPALTIDTQRYYEAHFVTTAGDFTITLDPKEAPHTVNNFVFLSEHNFYHCVIFHRVIPGFVIQGGDPTGTGNAGPGYTFADELPKTGHPTYPLYSVAMANSGPNTNGSQFFIVTGTSAENLANSYSLFGRVTSGIATIKAISAGGTAAGTPVVIQRILSVTITEGPAIS